MDDPHSPNNSGGQESGSDSGGAQPPPGTRNEPEANAYELLCELIGHRAARLIREFLRESSRCDPNAFLYRYALVTVAVLRVAANMPIVITRLLADFQRSLDRAVQQMQNTVQVHYRESPAQPSDASPSPLRHLYSRAVVPEADKKLLLWPREKIKRWFSQHALVIIGALVVIQFVYFIVRDHRLNAKIEGLTHFRQVQPSLTSDDAGQARDSSQADTGR